MHISFRFIKRMFEQHPILSNSCTGFATFSLGNILVQLATGRQFVVPWKNKYENSSECINWTQAFETGSLGIFMNGICMHYWFRLLEHMFGRSVNISSVLYKVAADQIVYAPSSIVIFFVHSQYLQQHEEQVNGSMVDNSRVKKLCGDRVLQDKIMKPGCISDNEFALLCRHKIGESLLPTWIADCAVWPFANFLNFKFIPLQYRPTYSATVQLFWQSYMSYVVSKK